MGDIQLHEKQIWSCKIGECAEACLLIAADEPMRSAIKVAYKETTGEEPKFIFSGWNSELTEGERAVVENRAPSEAHYQEWMDAKSAKATIDRLRKRVQELEAQLRTAYGYGSDAGNPPWMK